MSIPGATHWPPSCTSGPVLCRSTSALRGSAVAQVNRWPPFVQLAWLLALRAVNLTFNPFNSQFSPLNRPC